MKQKQRLVSVMVLAILVLGLAGCEWLAELLNPPNPLVGEWAGTFTPAGGGDPVNLSLIISDDGTFAETVTGVLNVSGTWTSDPDAQTFTMTVTVSDNPDAMPVGMVVTSTYTLSDSNDTLISTNTGGTSVLTRQ